MAEKIDLTRISLISTGLLVATIMLAPCTPSAAQERAVTSTDFSAQQPQDNKSGSKKAAPAGRPAPQRAAPQRGTPRVAAPQRRAPRTSTQTRAPSRIVTERKAPSRAVTQRRAPSRTVTERKATSRAVTQRKATSRTVTQQQAAPRVVTPKGTTTVTASRLRGVSARGGSRLTVRGQNYSAWRSGYRRRHGNGWWTFVALGTLGAIAIGSDQYYPYAYISAPEDYCEGFTEDGCQLMWQEVPTEEGDAVDQCVAYCPWH
jgi:hypothetical protein